MEHKYKISQKSLGRIIKESERVIDITMPVYTSAQLFRQVFIAIITLAKYVQWHMETTKELRNRIKELEDIIYDD